LNQVAHAGALADALHTETRLLGELTSVMRDQRDAIARDDLDSLDDAVFATHRVLLTLGEARRRRRALNDMLGDDDLSLDRLSELYDGEPPPVLHAAIASLSHAARTLHREVDVNRRVLLHAIDSGDQLLRSLSGAAGAERTYDRSPPRLAATNSAVLDRTV
jgi:hypothetical protein